MGTQLIPEYPGEVLMSDYIKIWPGEDGKCYVLTQVDKMSKISNLVATEAPTASTASRRPCWQMSLSVLAAESRGEESP